LSDDHLGIVQEYATHAHLEGTLKTYGAFSEQFARFFFQQLVCGLHHCHKQGAAHGNIKLSNLLLKVHSTATGVAPVLKLSGFEHAKEDPLAYVPSKPVKSSRSSSPAHPAKVQVCHMWADR
jgi:serine/threonine-protein kinase SRK2